MDGFFGTLIFATALRAEPGFYSPADVSAPEAVRSASASVFRIVALKDPVFIAALNLDQVQLNLKELCSENPRNLQRQLTCKFLRACVAEQNNSCQSPYATSGTAFLAGDGQTVWTAFHNLYPVHEPALAFLGPHLASAYTRVERFKTMAVLEPEFLLINDEGQTVFDSRTERERPHYLNFGDPADFVIATQLQKYWFDFAKIRIGRVIGKPLAIAKSTASDISDSRYYAVGFPNQTANRENNSDGFSLRISWGNQTSSNDFVQKVAATDSEKTAVKKYFTDDRFIFFDGDSAPGISGGPLVNAKGEVAAIVTFTTSDEDSYADAGAGAVRIDYLSTYDLNRFHD